MRSVTLIAVLLNIAAVNDSSNAIHVAPAKKEQIDTLVQAIIHVESRGNDSAIGDNGLAVGCLQIHPICVREANRLIGFDSFDLDDRYNRQQSINIFNVIRSRIKNPTNERVARQWNGGPKGHKKRATLRYWRKVKKQL